MGRRTTACTSTTGRTRSTTPASAFGNGRSDFIGDGAAIVGNGAGTTLVVNHARVDNTGTVRTGIVADNGAKIVKNSSIRTSDGPLPAGYTPTIDLGYMMQVPWMLSIGGDVRATNLLGNDTKATYIKSKIISQGWGALSKRSTGAVPSTTGIARRRLSPG